MATTRMVALLRGVNVGGKRRVPMDELRQLATAAGCLDVQTYVQSGNLVFSWRGTTEQAAQALEADLEERFGFAVDVIVRTAQEWKALSTGCPLPDAARARPQLLHVALSRQPMPKSAAEALMLKAGPAEAVSQVGQALWVDYGGGVGRSKLTPAALDKAAGSTVTARNWKTVQALAGLLEA